MSNPADLVRMVGLVLVAFPLLYTLIWLWMAL